MRRCDVCMGTGIVDGQWCTVCDGDGWISVEEEELDDPGFEVFDG